MQKYLEILMSVIVIVIVDACERQSTLIMLRLMMLGRLMKSLTTLGTFMIRESQEPGQQVISELFHTLIPSYVKQHRTDS